MLLAADAWGHDAEHARQTVAMLLETYCQAVAAPPSDSHDDQLTLQHCSGPIGELLAKTAVNTVADLLDHHTQVDRNNVRATCACADKHPELSENRVKKITKAVEAYGRHTTPRRPFGCSMSPDESPASAALACAALVLVEGEGSPDGNKLLDIKEAWPSAAAAWVGRPMPGEPNEAQRIVDVSAVHQSTRPTAGLDALGIGTAWYRCGRWFRTKTARSSIGSRTIPSAAARRSWLPGQIVGQAHLRGG